MQAHEYDRSGNKIRSAFGETLEDVARIVAQWPRPYGMHLVPVFSDEGTIAKYQVGTVRDGRPNW